MPIALSASCRKDFYPAYHTSGTRSLTEVYWVVLHDEEAPDAKGAAQYFRESSSGGSAHLCVDVNTCYRCLPNEAIPWGAASAPKISANQHGFHIEQAGYAAWTPAEWLAHEKELERAAFKTAQHLHLFKRPVQFVTQTDLVTYGRGGARKDGVTTHAEISAASRVLDPANASRYSHSDPGSNWPRPHFMALVGTYYKQF